MLEPGPAVPAVKPGRPGTETAGGRPVSKARGSRRRAAVKGDGEVGGAPEAQRSRARLTGAAIRVVP